MATHDRLASSYKSLIVIKVSCRMKCPGSLLIITIILILRKRYLREVCLRNYQCRWKNSEIMQFIYDFVVFANRLSFIILFCFLRYNRSSFSRNIQLTSLNGTHIFFRVLNVVSFSVIILCFCSLIKFRFFHP
jgi:hypothetical protein